MYPNQKNRRSFIKNASIATLATLTIPDIITQAFAEEKISRVALKKNNIILFQGDSITDWGRNKGQANPNTSSALGAGYPLVVSAQLLWQYADLRLQIFNRGISAQKVFQLAERWDADCIGLKPDILSIHIGVNDYWHTITSGYKGTIETYRTDYHNLIDRTLKALPEVKIIIMEPYGVKGVKAVDDSWYPAFDEFRAAARDVAEKFGTAFIPLQKLFDKALEVAPGSWWTIDGVHPSVAGEGLIGHAWMNTVKP